MLNSMLRTLLLAGALALTTLAPSMFPPDVSGVWHVELTNEAASESITVSIQQQDSLLSGSYVGYYALADLSGVVKKNTITFSYAIDGVPVNHIGYLDGKSIVGVYHAGEFDRGEFRGTRIR